MTRGLGCREIFDVPVIFDGEEAFFTLANEKPGSLPESRLWRVPAHGRALSAVNVGCLEAQFGSQASGSTFEGVTVARRPSATFAAVNSSPQSSRSHMAEASKASLAHRHRQPPRLVVNVQTTKAAGAAERDPTAAVLGEIEVRGLHITVGADKATINCGTTLSKLKARAVAPSHHRMVQIRDCASEWGA